MEATSDEAGHGRSSAIPARPDSAIHYGCGACGARSLCCQFESGELADSVVLVGQIARDGDCGGLGWCFSGELIRLWLLQPGGLWASD